MQPHSTFFSGSFFVLGLGITLYPLLSNYYVERHQSAVYTEYRETLKETDDGRIKEALAAANAYNEELKKGGGLPDGYEDLLNLTGNSVMGYVEIPSLSLRVAIRHGDSPKTLDISAGHLEGTSRPVGGEGCHAVITAHSGMPGQKMFSDLDRLVEGDLFYLEVLDQRLAYRVDQILTVLPTETDALSPERGKDLCTLVTCTPFGVNTHRLLVRGSRVPPEKAEKASVTDSVKANPEEKHTSSWEKQYRLYLIRGVAASVGCGAILFFIFFIKNRKQKEKEKYHETDS